MKIFVLFFGLALSSCAATVGNGILVQYDPKTPFTEVQLDRYCDLEDAAACFLAGKKFDAPSGALPIFQGVANSGKAIFSVVVPNEKILRWYLLDRTKISLTPLPITRVITRPQSLFRVEHIQAAELIEGHTYELIAGNEVGKMVDHRTFQTLSQSPAELRFALISDTDPSASDQATQWSDLHAQDVSLIFALGNNVYANAEDQNTVPQILWDQHLRARNSISFFRAEKLTPIFATWNERDFGKIKGDETYPHLNESREILETFFPSLADAKTVLDGPGVSRALMLGSHTFILFDNRTFRTAPGGPIDEQSHFGRIQEDWALGLIDGLPGSIWLLSGDPWFTGASGAYSAIQPQSFKRFMRNLEATYRKRGAKDHGSHLVFGGGNDAAGISRAQSFPAQETYELTAGSFYGQNQSLAQSQKKNKKLMRLGESSARGYLLVNARTNKKNELQLSAQARDGGRVAFARELVVKPLIKKARR